MDAAPALFGWLAAPGRVAMQHPATDGDAEAFLKPDTVHNSFAQDLPEADRWLIVESQRPITLSANTTPSGPAAWKSVPSWTVVGTEDRVIPPDTQRHMAERAGATVTEVAGSHVSMVSRPPGDNRRDPRRRRR
jgi:pimeloyl-ACP methyl ester carboxylesterase